ncbi:hypothetical protein AMTR_s00020p00221500 [Amborella trichopoda]|uniref:Uncharacterized protein n=1 Tax=Amborella trichopoda TaxID=13333 RepID=W1PVQ1_AMBTC|nr:hypothetical protein AMTR_s00020p00221500 [Amborella trichopoda]
MRMMYVAFGKKKYGYLGTCRAGSKTSLGEGNPGPLARPSSLKGQSSLARVEEALDQTHQEARPNSLEAKKKGNKALAHSSRHNCRHCQL